MPDTGRPVFLAPLTTLPFCENFALMKIKNSVATGGGDRGMTKLFSGERVPKNSERTDAFGDLDELVSILGVARASSRHAEVREAILDIQRNLFVIGSELATSADKAKRLLVRVDVEMVRELNRRHDKLRGRMKRLNGFIIPGGNSSAAHIDLARAIARRCERKAAGLVLGRAVPNQLLLVWMNRLSNYLWLLARLEEGKSTMVKSSRT
jgi:cob(I)alamin adenosyltransferase